MRRIALTATSAAVSALLLIPLATSTAWAGPPGIPTAEIAVNELAAVAVAEETHADTYDRKKFIHWATISGACNTRETVLVRDGENVQTDDSCAAVSGSWYSPYDGVTWTSASDIDIDHMVPLKEAWRSGAWEWTTAKRKAFANSLQDSQLWAVTDRVNQGKADQDPSTWRPPLANFECEYARSWVDVKFDWGLTMQPAERSALENMLATC